MTLQKPDAVACIAICYVCIFFMAVMSWREADIKLARYEDNSESICNITRIEVSDSRVFINTEFLVNEQMRTSKLIWRCGISIGCREVAERYFVGQEFRCWWYPDLSRISEVEINPFDDDSVIGTRSICIFITMTTVSLFVVYVCCYCVFSSMNRRRSFEQV